MKIDLDVKAENVVRKIKHYLITSMGVTLEEANPEEFYRAFALTIREELMINWTAAMKTYREKQARTIYYLCMEYLPGRFMGSNITNIHAMELVQRVMKKVGRSLFEELLYEPDPGLGNGGLGRLASCLLDSLATSQYPSIAYGLRYQYGIFAQEVWNGSQVERPDPWLLHENPWEFRRDVHAASVYYSGRLMQTKNKQGEEVFDLQGYEEVRALPYDIPIIGYEETGNYNVNTLRLWTTKESPRNFRLQRFNAGQFDLAGENTSLTDVLYPNDNNELGKRIRLKQEFLLASASVQDIIANYMRHHPDMTQFADKVRIQINDTHPSLVIPELMRALMKEHDFCWGEAWEVVRTCLGYTNHTVLRESLEEWQEERLRSLLPRQHRIIEKLNMQLCNEIRAKYPEDEDKVRRMSIIEEGNVRMAHLAIYGSQKVNGVAELHSEILRKELFSDFAAMYPERFINVTNGVTQRRWLLHSNPMLARLITRKIGADWITNFSEISRLREFANDPATLEELLYIKKENKKKFVQFLQAKNPIRDAKGRVLSFTNPLGEEAIFDMQVKRFHEYKRQLMNALHALMLYVELKKDKKSRKVPRQIIFAGKAAAGYEAAKYIIQLIYCIARKINSDDEVNDKLRVIFVENYDVSKAEVLIPAADLSEQISTAGMEASGTGNMKLSMNGALTIGTEDGANIEMHKAVTSEWWPFSFGLSADEIVKEKNSYNPWDIYSSNSLVKEAVDMIKSGELSTCEEEKNAQAFVVKSLLEADNGNSADKFFVLRDLPAYYETQKQVEELFLEPIKWANYMLHNIAGMGEFSTDTTIKNYAKTVWDLKPCPIDHTLLQEVRNEYTDHDQCRIL